MADDLDIRIDPQRLAAVKLVDPACMTDLIRTERSIETLVQEASAGWGVRPGDMITLRLAYELVNAPASAELDEAQRKLKGEQLSHGRTKKRLAEAESRVEALETALESLNAKLEAGGD